MASVAPRRDGLVHGDAGSGWCIGAMYWCMAGAN